MTAPATDGDTRLVHFRDPRAPWEIQFEIEREHMVLLRLDTQDGRLTMHARSKINGASYRLLLSFEAALSNTHCYSLQIDIDWQDQPPASHEHHRKSALGWFDLWLRHYRPQEPPSAREHVPARYHALVQQTLAAQKGLHDIAAVQQAILGGLRHGRSFSTAHKEGGTKIFYSNGRFVRSDYGDHEGRQEYVDEADFLASLRRFYDWQTSRATYPDKVDDYTAWKLILRLLEPAQNSSRLRSNTRTRSDSDGIVDRGASKKLARIVIGLVIAGALAATLLPASLSVATIGSPTGEAVGTPDTVALIISTQEPYVPSLHRDPSKDRFRLSLLVHARDGSGKIQHLPLIGQLDASRVQHASRMLGFDGKLIWLLAADITAYDPKSRRLVRLDDLRQANPALNSLWPIGYYEVADRLLVSTRDNRIVVEIDPQTLIARPLARPPLRKHPLPPHPVTSLLASPPSSNDGKLQPAFVRERLDAPPLRLANPESKLLTYWRKRPDLQRMLYVARVDTDGNPLWETETGIADLHQVLPDGKALALIGARPRIPDKLPEPILAIVRTDTGALVQHTLWIRE